MKFQTDIFQPISIAEDTSSEIIDIFDVSGKKTIELQAHSSLIYLVVISGADINLHIVSK